MTRLTMQANQFLPHLKAASRLIISKFERHIQCILVELVLWVIEICLVEEENFCNKSARLTRGARVV